MAALPSFTSVRDIRMDEDPALEAWLHHFLTENNLEYMLNPALVASPEQLRFMVSLDEDQVYIPAPDRIFFQFYQGGTSPEFLREYADAWRFVAMLTHSFSLPAETRRRILHLCRYRFQLYLASRMILPSRLIKRLVGIVLGQAGVEDPYREKKRAANERMAAYLTGPDALTRLQAGPEKLLGTIGAMRWQLDFLELTRLLRLSTMRDLWEEEGAVCDPFEMAEACQGCACLDRMLGSEESPRKKILYLPDRSGGFVADLAVIRSLLRQGHQVVLALKEGFYFNTPTWRDLREDPVLRAAVDNAFFLHDEAVGKNHLLRLLREHRFVIISDGTSEQLNLYRTSITFARAWKECDLIVVKGRRNAEVVLGTSHEFTRDAVCVWRDTDGFHLECKAKAAAIRKYTESDLLAIADGIISEMHEARQAGKPVMFYSAIIGSIPGQTRTAVEVVNAFVGYLRGRMENTCVINPAEHFSEGMDGDDLMFMWERVQRSGYLDVWRFQTVEDIEISFSLLGRKMPPEWLGKDATFSTGCTKEMEIALDVQKRQPELQIIGPAPEKFFRRREYGVGKYYDARLMRKG